MSLNNSSLVAIVAALLLSAGGSFATTRYVSPTGSPSSPFTNWASAAQDIQSAVDVSSDGDVILVTNGTYSTGARSMYGSMSNRVVVDKAIRVESVNGASVTIIRGGTGVRGVWLTNGAALVGFTVTNGATISAGDYLLERSGGNVWATSNGVVSNCVLVSGYANRGGGAVYGGRVLSSRLIWNTSSDNGGAASASVLFNCYLSGNSTYQAGGAWGSKLYNCTVVSNSAQYAGGVDNSAVTNSIVYFNSATVFTNNILNSSVGYSCSYPAQSGPGNFGTDPALVSWADPHLLGASPCIDAGTNLGYVATTLDMDGEARMQGARVDVGCDEYYVASVTGAISVAVTNWSTNLLVGVSGQYGVGLTGSAVGTVWNFGDGTVVSNTLSTSHSWSSSGTETVVFTAWNNEVTVAITNTVNVSVSLLQPLISIVTGGALTFTGQVINGGLGDQSLIVSNSGTADLNYSIGSDMFWLHVGSTNGGLSSGQAAVHTVSVSTRGLDAMRTYVGHLTIRDPNASNNPQIVTVELTLSPVVTRSKVVAWGRNDYGQTNVPSGLTNAIVVAAGFRHSMALCSDGTVVAWGTNDFGQTNVPVGLTSVVSVSAGAWHSMALRKDGTIAVWGDNTYGQTNIPSGLTNVVAIAGGAEHAMALRANGTVVAWGYNGHGQTNVPTSLTNAVAIAACGEHSLALRSDGTVVAWGWDGYGQTDIPGGLTNVSAIAGWHQSMALRGNGTIAAWGWNNHGQSNVPTGLTDAVSMVVGDFYSGALRANGTVVEWGGNDYGETNVPAGLTNVFALAGGGYHTLAIVPVQTLQVISPFGSPIPGVGSNDVIAGSVQSCSVTSSLVSWGTQFVCVGWIGTGSVPQTGSTNHVSFTITNDSSITWLWQTNVISTGSLSTAFTEWTTNLLVGATGTFTATVTGFYTGYYWDFGDGTVVSNTLSTSHSWSSSGTETVVFNAWNNGETVAITNTVNVYESLSQPVISVISGGLLTFNGQVNGVLAGQSLIVSNSGTADLNYSIGSDMFWLHVASTNGGLSPGQVADHTVSVSTRGLDAMRTYVGHLTIRDPNASNNPQVVTVELTLSPVFTRSKVVAWGRNDFGQTNVPSGLTDAVAVAAGFRHSLALRADGTVMAWGRNDFGQATVPADVTNVVAVSAGAWHSMALRADRTIAVWGDNTYGQANVPSGLTNIVAISGGAEHSMALRANGTVVAWGYNGHGQTNVPTSLTNAVAIAACGEHSLALRSDGTVVAWGWDGYGQTDIPGGLTNVSAIAGWHQSMALRGNGTIAAWGWNNHGQSNVPTGLTDAVSMVVGDFYSGALRANGTVVEWGGNDYGETNVPAGLTNVFALAGGGYHTLAIVPVQTLQVISPFGSPIPGVGSNDVIAGSVQSCSVTSSLVSWGTQFVCVGWIGTGSVPQTGSTNYVSFTITNDSSITWLWQTNVIATGNLSTAFAEYPNNLLVGETGTFAATLTGFYSGTYWDLGDGTLVSNALSVSHAWATPGTKQVTFVAWSSAMTVTGTVSFDVMSQHASYVSPNGAHIAPYTNWATAATDIQSAVDASVAGGVIWVSNGIYSTGARSMYGSVSNRVVVDKAVRVESVNGAAVTVIRGGVGIRGVWLTNGASLVGFTVTNGQTITSGDYLLERSGGNVWATGNGVVSNCVLVGGYANRGGGGVYGGQVFNSRLMSNTSSDNGGAASVSMLYNCYLAGNSTYQAGGAWGSKLYNCTVVSNAAQYAGGVDNSAVTNSIVYFNTATVFTNNILNSSVGYSCSYPAQSGPGNFETDPGLMAWDPAHLIGASPCIDTGTNLGYVTTTRDIDGELRLNGTRVDVGCDEYNSASVTGAIVVSVTRWTTNLHSGVAGQYAANVTGHYLGALWTFGDGTAVSNSLSTTHAWTSGGIVPVVFSAWNDDGTVAFTNTVNVSDLQPVIAVSPAGGLVFTGPVNGSVLGQSLMVSNAGAANLDYTMDSDMFWLSADHPSGTLVPGQSATHAITVSSLGLDAQRTYVGHLTIRDLAETNNLQIVTVTLTLSAPATPTRVVAWGRNDFGQTNVPQGLANVVAVAGGFRHSVALRKDGTVVAWGKNDFGQTNVPYGLTNVVAISAGAWHSMALRKDGTIAVWGDDTYGQTTVPAGLTNIVSISGGAEHSMALRADGTIVAWGYNAHGQTTIPSGLTNVVAIAACGEHSLALRANGTVAAWGWNGYGQTSIPSGLSNVVAIAGWHQSMALRSNGSVVAWGWNNYGQSTVPTGLLNVVGMAVGDFFSAALRADGKVVAWGGNTYGETNIPAGLTNVVAVAGGGYHTLAIVPAQSLTVMSSFGNPTPGVGTNDVRPGIAQVCSVTSPVISGGTQHVCVGWAGTGDVTANGTGTTVSVTITTNSTLTWLWRDEYYLDVGHEGAGELNMGDAWYTNGASVSLMATAGVGYAFSYWTGDVPPGATTSNPISLLMTQARTLSATFAPTGTFASGLILHYTFDEGAGSRVFDQSGNAHTGVVQGALWSSAGRMSGAMDFSSNETARVEVDLGQALFGKRAVTLAAWVKSKGNPGDWEAVLGSSQDSPTSAEVPAIFFWLNKRSLGNNAASYLWIHKDSGGDETCALNFTRTADQFHDGQWYHVVLTWDGATMKQYVAGVLDSSMATPSGYLQTNRLQYVGGHRSSQSWANFNGYIDDLRVYGRALSSNEVLSLYSGNAGTVSLSIEGDPDSVGSPAPLTYGTYDEDIGSVVTNTVESVHQAGDTRFLCAGWSGEGSVPAFGTTNSVAFTLTTNSLLIWQWIEEEYLDVGVVGDGTMDRADGWVVSGSNIVLTATPEPGNYFSHWSGDVDPANEQMNPLSIVLTQPMDLTAVFDHVTYSIAGNIFVTGTQTVRVEACSGPEFTNVVSATVVGSGNRSYVLADLPASRDYWVWAYVDSDGSMNRSAGESAGACGLNPIHLDHAISGADISLAHVSAPTGLVARAGANSVTLNWTPNSDAGVVGYHVYRMTTNGAVRLTGAPVTQPEYTDSGLDAGSTPSYTVTAVMSVEGGTLLESDPSSPVSVTVGQVVLWMPDYHGPASSDVRLRVSAENIDDVLGDVMQVSITYDPLLVKPMTQVDGGLPTVERTILTESMDITDNGATASGTLLISSTNQLTMDHAKLWLLGCDLVGKDGHAVSIKCGFTNAVSGGGWQWLANGGNVNDGQARSVEVGELPYPEACVLSLKTADREVRTDTTPQFVHVLRDGDAVPGVHTESDLPSCMLPYVDNGLAVNIGTNDALFCVELEGSTKGHSADFFDAVLLVEYNAGATLAGEGHLFDVLFRVASNAVNGAVMTNAITSVHMVDRHGDVLPVDITDTALFTVQSDYILGDINGDGVVDVSGDFTLAMKIAVGQFEPTAYQLMAGDIDGDGVITKTDAVLIKRIIDGLDTNPGNATPSGGGWIIDPNAPDVQTNGTISVSLENAFATPGSDGPVNITVHGANDVAGMDLVVNYDPAILTLTSATNAGIGAGMGFTMNTSTGTVELILAGSGPLGSTSGVVATLQFHVNVAAPYGALSPLTIAACETIDEYGRSLAADLVHGSVTVAYSDTTDSDGDGLSDFAEQFQDGSRGYSYWSAQNLYGRDSNILDPDTDDDGMNDGNEIKSGTSLTDAADVLALSSAAPQASNGVSVAWQSVTGHYYRVECSTNLRSGFVTIATGIVGQAGTTVYTDTGVGSRPKRLYRVINE